MIHPRRKEQTSAATDNDRKSRRLRGIGLSDSSLLLPSWVARGLVVAAVLASVSLTAYAASTAPQPAWEIDLLLALQAANPPALHWLAEALSAAGEFLPSLVLAAVASAVLIGAGRRSLAGFVFAAIALRFVSTVMKGLIERPRPSTALVDVAHTFGGSSFPSGHVLGATLFSASSSTRFR